MCGDDLFIGNIVLLDVMTKPLDGHNIAVAIPAYDGKIPISTVSSLLRLSGMLGSLGARMSFLSQTNVAIVQIARNRILAEVMAEPSITGVLHIDGDISFDPGDAIKLIAASVRYDVIVGLYRAKTDDQDLYFVEPEGPYDQYGVMTCKRAPLGFAYMGRSVLKRLWDDHADRTFTQGEYLCRNVFEVVYDKESQTIIGEDFVFCDKVRAAGFSIAALVDIRLDHIGTKSFTGSFKEGFERE